MAKREKLRVVEPKQLLRPSEAAEEYPATAGTFGNWRHEGRGPKYYKQGRMVLYDRRDLDAFFKRRPVLTKDSLNEIDVG